MTNINRIFVRYSPAKFPSVSGRKTAFTFKKKLILFKWKY